MTVEQLEDKLAILGYGNIQFHLYSPSEVEAMVELSDGQFLGVTGRTFTEAAEGMLSKLEQLERGAIFGSKDFR